MKRTPSRNLFAPNAILPEARAKIAALIAEMSEGTMALIDTDSPLQPLSPFPSLLDLLKNKFGLRIEHGAPLWAKRAAKLAFDSLAPRRHKPTASEAYNIGFDSGYMHVANELVASMPRKNQEIQILSGVSGCSAILKEHWAQQPIEKAADFFCGLRDGEKLTRGAPERAQQMAQRTKIYCAIATRWKEIVPGVLNSTGELHQWLLDQHVIVPGTDSSEIRQVCAKIGLRYKSPGKPRKLKM